MDFVTGLPVSTNWKSENYDFILVIVNYLTKIIHYKPVKPTIDAAGWAEVICKRGGRLENSQLITNHYYFERKKKCLV